MVEEAYAQSRHLEVGQKVSVAGIQFPVVGIINSGMRRRESRRLPAVYGGGAGGQLASEGRTARAQIQRPARREYAFQSARGSPEATHGTGPEPGGLRGCVLSPGRARDGNERDGHPHPGGLVGWG